MKRATQGQPARGVDCDAEVTIQPGEPQRPWQYRAPDSTICEYLCGRWYTIAQEDRSWQVLILLADGARLARLAGQVVARADQLFARMRKGLSLRLVVAAGNSPRMIEHAYWVACLRGKR